MEIHDQIIGDLESTAHELREVIPRAARAVAAAEMAVVPIMRQAGQSEAQQIKTAIHDRSGVLDRSVGVSVRRLRGGGVQLKYGSIRTQAFNTRKGVGGVKKQNVFYDHFVDQGTGVYGPKHRKILRRGMFRMGSVLVIPSGEGQKPQRMFQESAERFSRSTRALDEVIDDVLTHAIEGTR